MGDVVLALDNPYWDAVKDHVDWTGSLWRTPAVNRFGESTRRLNRHDLVSRYSWTIPDPTTLAFVAEHAAGGLVDPMAGTGYWAWLLNQLGVDVVCYDLEPGTNHWHAGRPLHVEVARMDGATAAAKHPDRTLLLAWPPYDHPTGTDIVKAYTGQRVIFIGEPEGGCTGDDDLYALLADDWSQVAEHVPVQWNGIHDCVTVHDRPDGA
jgi:hypothetical protein